jgi:hypothetical protein
LVLVFRKCCIGILVGTPGIMAALFRHFVLISSKHMFSELMRMSLNMTKIKEFSNIIPSASATFT